MRSYYTWRFVESSDKSYYFGTFGLWSSAELPVGIITGCLPVMPAFFQHAGPKIYGVFSTQSTSATHSGHSPRSKRLNPTTLTNIRGPFSKHSTGLSTSDADTDPYAQPHGEYCMLDEFAASQHRETRDPIPAPGGGRATTRDDLEYGHQGS